MRINANREVGTSCIRYVIKFPIQITKKLDPVRSVLQTFVNKIFFHHCFLEMFKCEERENTNCQLVANSSIE